MNLSWVEFNINNKNLEFLVDTGASLCAIKLECLHSNIPIFKNKLEIKGIGGNLISEGYVYLNLKVNSTIFRQKFFVFKNLNCSTNGIIGIDFLTQYNGIINYELNQISLKNENREIILNLNSKNTNQIILSQRCETIYYLPTHEQEDCVIRGKEVCDGVFVANTICRPQDGKVPVRILNTRENDVYLNNFIPEIRKLSHYDICELNNDNVTVERAKNLFKLLKLNYLNKEEQIEIENICAKFADIFHLPGDKLTKTNLYKQTIHLKENTSPIYVKPYRLPYSQQAEIHKQIEEMCENDIIEEARSAWSAPLLLVPKKSANNDKCWRIVLDYRLLNKSIRDEKFPLPNITEIFDSLSGAVYFSHLDLSQGYYQLELDPNSRQYTAFTTNRGQYQMKRLPMGLKTSPSSFSRLMTVAMSGLNYERCLVYLDDLIVFGRNLQDHNKNLISIFQRLRKVNLKLNPNKCEFLKKEILYLGHEISEHGISPDKSKIQIMQKYPRPTNSDELKRFVAFANYYRKFIPNFAEKAICLNLLCRKNVKFEWTDECETSFNFFKNALSTPPVLDYPDFSEDNVFILQTDSSGKALGAVLTNKNKKPVAYASRSLNKAELNYPIVEKEMLALVFGVKHFRPYLYGRHFKILTDHRPLVYLFSMTNPASRLTKFRLCLEEYDFEIEYIKGKDNVLADALSRIIITSDELKNLHENSISVMTRAQCRKNFSKQEDEQFSIVENNSTSKRPDQPKIVEILKNPKNSIQLSLITNEILNNLHKVDHVSTKTNSFYYIPSQCSLFYNPYTRSALTQDVLLRDLDLICKEVNIPELIVIKYNKDAHHINNLLYMLNENNSESRPRICIIKNVKRIYDDETKKLILNDFHLLPTSGHAGINRMTNNIKKYYFWPGMNQDIQNFVKKCSSCQKHKHSKHVKQPMCITSTATYAFQKIYLDIVGPIEKDINEFCYILTLQCELTKFTEAYPLTSKDSVTVAKAFVDNFILRYGIPTEIATDRGTEFISQTMKDVCKLLNINQLYSTAYHHESIGSLENSHKVLGSYLRIQAQQQKTAWSLWIPYWCFSFNTTVHSETKYTPFELVFGRICNLPSNLMSHVDPLYTFDNYPLEMKFRLQKAQEDARNNLLQSKHKRKTLYDRTANPINYEKNDLILIKSEVGNKLSEIYDGPYKVLEDLEPNVLVNKNGKEVVVHKNRTKPFRI